MWEKFCENLNSAPFKHVESTWKVAGRPATAQSAERASFKSRGELTKELIRISINHQKKLKEKGVGLISKDTKKDKIGVP